MGEWVPDLEYDAKAHPDDTIFVQGNAYDNIEVLGERYIEHLRRDLPTLIFDVEVLNKHRVKIGNAFYDEFNEESHTYYNIYTYGQVDEGQLATKSNSNDYDQTLPLQTSFDFNAAFNSRIIGVHHQVGTCGPGDQ